MVNHAFTFLPIISLHFVGHMLM
uniref:Uncharacterized protein n=1 Tax=Tetranychus urticae TaxID=32264 RepID=T1KDK2_TETUR